MRSARAVAEPADVSVVLLVFNEQVDLERLLARLAESRPLAGFAHSHDPILVTLPRVSRDVCCLCGSLDGDVAWDGVRDLGHETPGMYRWVN